MVCMGVSELIGALNSAIDARNQGRLVTALSILNELGLPDEGLTYADTWRLESNYLRGRILADLGKWTQATYHLLAAYQVNPKREEVCELLGRCFLEIGDLVQGGYFLKKHQELGRFRGRENTVVIGDSHSKFLFAGIPSCRVNWIGPMTMYRVGRDGLGALDFAANGITGQERVILSFGEIDVRVHMHERALAHEKKCEGVVADLLSAFFL